MIRRAAAVILHRGVGTDLEVYLAERSPKLRFLGGYHAFPGGVEDDHDRAHGERSLARCAQRELFEETGVLLGATPAIDAARREAIRGELLNGEQATQAQPNAGFAALLGELAAVDLREVCRVLTPAFAPIRYDTVFFLAALPKGQTPAIRVGELVSGRFWRPREALARWRAGELLIAPPVLTLLEVLERAGLRHFAEMAGGLSQAFAAGALPPVRFTPGVMMASLATATIPPATTTNSYLVGNERVWLIDPGTADADELNRLHDFMVQLEQAGRTLAGILLTHHHPDHIGGVAFLSRELELEVRGHELTLNRLPEGVTLGATLGDGDRIDLGAAPDGRADWGLRVWFTPGHARGHLCFQEDRYHALFAGDMVSTLSTIVIDPPEGHLATYMHSLARLEALQNLGTLYPAHGPPAIDGRRVLRRFIAHREERQAKLIAVLSAQPRSAAELLPLVYDDADPAILPIAARSLAAGLERLAEEGRATCVGDVWRMSTGA